MHKLNIRITKANLVSFGVELKQGKPEVNATIALLTDGGKVVTTYSIYTDDWHSDNFDLPIEAMPLIGDLARILEGVAVRHCNDSQLALPPSSKMASVEVNRDVKKDELITAEDISKNEKPINLDDIPF